MAGSIAGGSAPYPDGLPTSSPTGDIKAYIFRVDLTRDDQFREDGSFASPWITGAFAGKTCHNGETSFNLDFPSEMTIHGD